MVPVLIVDDSPTIRIALPVMLERQVYPIVTVEHGGEALAHLRSTTDRMVVLLGLYLPVMDGEDVLRALAADPVLAARHRFIMMSADEDRATRDPVAALRAQLGVPFIPKPFRLSVATNAVAQAAQLIAACDPALPRASTSA